MLDVEVPDPITSQSIFFWLELGKGAPDSSLDLAPFLPVSRVDGSYHSAWELLQSPFICPNTCTGQALLGSAHPASCAPGFLGRR